VYSPVPLFSAKAANAGLDLIGPLQRVVDRHWYVLGEEVARFEEQFAAYLNVTSCISVANGSDALELALRALGIGPGSRVALVANAGFYGSTAVHAVGATPEYVEVDAQTLTMSPDSLKDALQRKPDAVIVTHLFGQMASIEELTAIARDAGIPLIEDCAQSHGARCDGRLAGSFGTLACFSFYPTKNLGAIGDGGAVVTSDAALDSVLRRLRQYGWNSKYHVDVPGGRNSRLDELQAAVLLAKLPHLDRWNAERRAIAQRYNTAFAGLDMQLPCSTGDDYVGHLYVVRVKDRTRFVQAMRESGIGTDIHYPVPDHRQAAYPAQAAVRMPVTEQACTEIVTLPCFPGLDHDSIERVIAAVQAYFASLD